MPSQVQRRPNTNDLHPPIHQHQVPPHHQHPPPAPPLQQHYHHHPIHIPSTSGPIQNATTQSDTSEGSEIFVDPAMGTPLGVYVEKDVLNHDLIVSLVKKHGGNLSSNYSSVPYVLVDRTKESGQSLYRQYHNKKGKVVLDAQWVIACVQAGELLTFKRNWGGMKVNGNEVVIAEPQPEPPRPTAPELQLAPPPGAAEPAPSTSGNGQRRKKKGRQAATSHNETDTGIQQPLPAEPPTVTNPPAPQPPSHFPFPSALPTLPPVPVAPNFSTWSHVAPSSTVHPPHPHAHSSQAQTATQPPPPSAALSTPQSQTQSPLPPQQQSMTLAQIHHHPPPPHVLRGYPPATASASALARGPWYGVPPPAPAAVNALGIDASRSPNTQPSSSSSAGFTVPPPPSFEPPSWPHGSEVYYAQHFAPFSDQQYVVPPPQSNPTGAQPPPSTAGDDGEAEEGANDEENRGRKRKRVSEAVTAGGHGAKKSKQNAPATDPASLVPALAPPRRSPTPPARVVKSTYGGNLFTAEDINYLKKYIDWCVDMGLVLSLREICERLAIKAPHHTFYSWRRYCNKHKIKLGSYQMGPVGSTNGGDGGGDEDDDGEGGEGDSDGEVGGSGPSRPVAGPSRTIGAPSSAPARDGRNRSPTPPRSLHRSTTGKGIAFTEEDVAYLVKYMAYRKQKEPNLNMPNFWNDLAAKAPHHSRASWLKYWRRHRHEIEVPSNSADSGGGAGVDHPGPASTFIAGSNGLQIPSAPAQIAKRQRYSHEDDILLARFWAREPQGTSDKLFQEFARMHPHHPWKGWQEHHRIHKTQIDHLIKLHLSGVDLSTLPAPPQSKTGRAAASKE
ncbi:hypothetical protein M407DRAFT_21313 [Tulasnella calospora MUT 4182]|uniref:BRCT domain-containing protein n=1 Tax=Tulasnella calospora MUT 4182 TaxID=1051891 RepID=A0A0C3QEG7_9AGAM|nr:hypothetical protein M407DRAFT_21313 [Tulasnella calospora MUT 4182]